jgi:hypothetical protein
LLRLKPHGARPATLWLADPHDQGLALHERLHQGKHVLVGAKGDACRADGDERREARRDGHRPEGADFTRLGLQVAVADDSHTAGGQQGNEGQN